MPRSDSEIISENPLLELFMESDRQFFYSFGGYAHCNILCRRCTHSLLTLNASCESGDIEIEIELI